MPYWAQYDSEGGRVEARVAVVGTQGPDYRIVEWLEGPLHEARTVVALIHLRYEPMHPEERCLMCGQILASRDHSSCL